uniref:KIB1-4 beta-propeller domain-containing protein n=1 Tax=Aegilops tauschii TaxID=37682 RepID=R7W2N9_AEGTA
MGLVPSILQCCGLLSNILDFVVANLPDPANCARCRTDDAVCPPWPWHLAVRRYGPEAHLLPWTTLCSNVIISPYSGDTHPLPDNARSIGSTDDWLALSLGKEETTQDDKKRYVVHNYVLHNHFTNRSLPLPELDAIVIDDRSRIRKFLMRSTVHDFIVVIINNRKHPLIVFQQGKGVWSPEPPTTPYIYIIDIAFLGDKLYGITKAEDLIPLDLALDGDGRPMVTMGTRVIKKSLYYDYYESHTIFCEEDNDQDDDQNEEKKDEEEEEEEEEEEANGDEEDDEEEEEDNDLTYINSSIEYDHDAEPDDIIIISRHLIESHGKLFMVRHRRRLHPDHLHSKALWVTLQVDVFEADFSTHAWVPTYRRARRWSSTLP